MPTVFALSDALTEAQQQDLSVNTPLRPLIIGPKAILIRYGVSSEKASGLIGNYDPTDTLTYSIPGFEDTSLFDADYSKIALTFDNAHLQYAEKLISDGNGTIEPGDATHKVVASALNFADYTNPLTDTNYPISSLFEDRGVKVGDIVYLWATVSMVVKTMWTSVTGFENTVVAASIGSTTADDDNATTDTDSGTATFVAGSPNNHVVLEDVDVDASLYDGSPDGNISETYTVTVTTGGVPDDALLSVVSASGNDDYTDITPAAFDDPTTISSDRKLYVTFRLDGDLPVDLGVEEDEFVVGQSWTIEVTGNYTAVTATSGGTYTGTEYDQTPTYTVEVTRGGPYNVDLAVADPTVNPTMSTSATGGSIADGTYHLKVTFTGDSGETTNTVTPTSIVTAGGDLSTVDVPSPAQPTGAVGWNIYFSNTGAGGTYKIQGATRPFGPTVTLTSYSGAGATMPSESDATYEADNPTPPQITVTRDDGVDSAGAIDVVEASTEYPVGALGVTISFNQTRLVKGDIWTITVTTQATEGYTTLVLKNDLASAGLDAASDLNMRFFIKADGLVIPHGSVESPYGNNYTIDSESPDIQIAEGIVAYAPDGSWTVDDEQVALPIKPGNDPVKMYLTYRQWAPDASNEVGIISSLDDLEDALGTIDPDNPIAQAVQWALQNTPTANNVNVITANATSDEVRYIVLGGDPTDADNWTSALELVTGRDAPTGYNIVPLTTDTDILETFASNVTSESADENNRYRQVFVTPVVAEATAIVNEEINGSIVMAKLIDDPSTTGNQYTYLFVPAGNAEFITKGVVAGDKVRFQFGSDVYGNETYNTYTVSEVVSEDALLVRSGPASAVDSPIRVEVWRTASTDNVRDQLIALAASFANKRVKVLWPDLVSVDGSSYPSYFLSAGLATVAGAIPANQSMSRMEVIGPTVNLRSTYFTNSQLQELDDAGVYIVQQQPASEGGRFYVRHAVTTAATGDAATDEEQAVRALDAIGFAYINGWASHYGNSTITGALVSQMRADFQAVTSTLKSIGRDNSRVGGLLQDAELVSLYQSQTNKTHMVAIIRVTIAYPFMQAELTIQV